jgi:hypothetical protein
MDGTMTDKTTGFFSREAMKAHSDGHVQSKHWSDCAVHSEPAYPKGECDCGGYEPVAIIHRNEYNEYRLEPHDDFKIDSIPMNVDVPLFKSTQRKRVLFPTMLRKMWSGGEVQAWLDNNVNGL